MSQLNSSHLNDETSQNNNSDDLPRNIFANEINVNCLSYLQTKQRRIDHRRNKSEPLIRANSDEHDENNSLTNLQSSSTSTTSNESAISHSSSQYPNVKSPTQKLKSSTKKKKSWLYPFQSTYRQKNDEFRKIFKELPSDERLIVDYSCAWQKEILIQGRMYISGNYLCFHANFLKWETRLTLHFRDIVLITREKTAKVIPNAIEFKNNKNEKYFFASFATRDKTFATISKIWKTISIDRPLSSEDIWNIIRQNYGEHLDLTTDDEDSSYQQKQTFFSTPNQIQTKENLSSNTQNLTPNSTRSKSSEKEDIEDQSSLSSHGEHFTDDEQYLIPIGEEANTNTLIRQPFTNSEMKYLSTCPCENHLSTQLIDRTYSISVQRLFDFIFGGDEQFLREYHQSRRIKDYQGNQWKVNEQTGKRERISTYKVDVAAVFGATTISSNEKQVIDNEVDQSHYIIDTEVRNEGIKYADTFYVASRYCLVQIGPNKSHLKLTCEVRYVKSVMMIIKSFIEKNAMAALQDSFTDLNNRIELSTSTVKRLEHQSLNRQRSMNNNSNETEQTIHKRKFSRKESIVEKNSNEIIEEPIRSSPVLSSPMKTKSSWSLNHFFLPFALLIMLLLVSVNIFLYLKLNQIDEMTDRLIKTPPMWFNGFVYPKEENQWSILLKRQEEFYEQKLHGLHQILISTHNALKNVTDALSELSKISNGSTMGAPTNAFQRS